MKKYNVKVMHNGNEETRLTGLTLKDATEMVEAFNKVMKEMGNSDVARVVEVKEFNQHEKAVRRLISEAVSELIGGWENCLYDYPEDSEEYKDAKAMLNHDTLFTEIYNYVMADSRKNRDSHIRFAGKKFIEEEIEKRLAKEGYGKEGE